MLVVLGGSSKRGPPKAHGAVEAKRTISPTERIVASSHRTIFTAVVIYGCTGNDQPFYISTFADAYPFATFNWRIPMSSLRACLNYVRLRSMNKPGRRILQIVYSRVHAFSIDSTVLYQHVEDDLYQKRRSTVRIIKKTN